MRHNGLVLTRCPDQRVMIGENIVVTVIEIKGNSVRLGIAAPPEVTIHREEVAERIKQNEETRTPEAILGQYSVSTLLQKPLTPEHYDYIKRSRLWKIAGIAYMSRDEPGSMQAWECRYLEDVFPLINEIESLRHLLSSARDFIVEGGSMRLVGAPEFVDLVDKALQ